VEYLILLAIVAIPFVLLILERPYNSRKFFAVQDTDLPMNEWKTVMICSICYNYITDELDYDRLFKKRCPVCGKKGWFTIIHVKYKGLIMIVRKNDIEFGVCSPEALKHEVRNSMWLGP